MPGTRTRRLQALIGLMIVPTIALTTVGSRPAAAATPTSMSTVLVDKLTDTSTGAVVATTTTRTSAPDSKGNTSVVRTIVDGTGTAIKTDRYTAKAGVASVSTTTAVNAVKASKRNISTMRANGLGLIVSEGCCSDQGRHDLNFYATTHGGSGLSYVTMHFSTNICWGGGTPGVRWGAVHSCDYPAYTNYWPARQVVFDVKSVGIKWSTPRVVSSVVGYFPWANMNYAPNTGWHDAESGQVTGCTTLAGNCTTDSLLAEVWFHANGEFDWRIGQPDL